MLIYMARFEIDTEIFKSQQVLDSDYQPETFLERSEEEQALTSALLPLARSGQPDNTFIYGQTGTGKTCAVNIILDDLKHESKSWDHDICVMKVSCNNKTNYDLSVELTNRLRPDDDPVPGRGFQEGKVMDWLLEEMESLDESFVVIVLDEVENLGDDPGLLYQIPRARETGKLEDTQPCLITISNNFRYLDHLEPKTLATLRGQTIHFDPYNADQLGSILHNRADKAFNDGVLEDGVIPYIAARAAQNTGSARHALNVLRKAGRLAEETGDELVTENDHAKKAFKEVKLDQIATQLADLSAQEHALMYALALLDQDNQTPCRRDTIYSIYENITTEIGLTPKATRTIHEDLNELGFNGFVSRQEENQGERGGRYYTYGLDMPTESIIRALEDETELIEGNSSGENTANHSLSQFKQ